MQPLISIIIPTYNRGHLLGETLDSIISQTWQNWECIVVDDRSGDYTLELMELYTARDPRIFYYQRPVERLKGANSCRNYGYEKSGGQYINWFDDDDLMHFEKLERQLKYLEENDYSFCVCQSLVFREQKSNIIGLRSKNIISDNTFFDYLTMKIVWLTQAPLWKRKFLENLEHLFDENLMAAQEWEFHLRVLNKSPTYAVIKKPLVFLREHDQSITYQNNEGRRLYNYFLARLKIYQNLNLKLDLECEEFLRDYLVKSFKKMIIANNPHAFKAYNDLILSKMKFSINAYFNAVLAIIAFRVIGKGNVFLKQIKSY